MFKRFTANPKRETNDCAIRSFANAEGRKWEEVAKDFFDLALEQYLMPNDFSIAQDYADKRGYEIQYGPFEGTLSVLQFCLQHPTGRWVVLVEDHALSVIDGDYYDLVDCANHAVMNFWEIK